mmetsp:Transcript_17670/g.38721  ORF Transcript_17670/g.38721 Transcript_17670/m.38721 type:complete len:231 (-) Transcript_17670:461-1153(-)
MPMLPICSERLPLRGALRQTVATRIAAGPGEVLESAFASPGPASTSKSSKVRNPSAAFGPASPGFATAPAARSFQSRPPGPLTSQAGSCPLLFTGLMRTAGPARALPAARAPAERPLASSTAPPPCDGAWPGGGSLVASHRRTARISATSVPTTERAALRALSVPGSCFASSSSPPTPALTLKSSPTQPQSPTNHLGKTRSESSTPTLAAAATSSTAASSAWAAGAPRAA